MLRVVDVNRQSGNMSVKSVPVDDVTAAQLLREAGLTATDAEDTTGLLPISDLYKRVAWMHRAISLRAGALASLPFALYRDGDEIERSSEEYHTWAHRLKRLLAETEGDLCATGEAYWLVVPNRYGFNWYPKRLHPKTITPKFDNQGDLVGFKRRLGPVEDEYPCWNNHKNKMFILHFWTPSMAAETGPGEAPGHASQYPAETLRNLQRYTRRFFLNGAVKATLFFMDSGSGSGSGMQPMPTETELKTVVAAWKRLTSGIKNAWTTVAMRYALKPYQIGTDPKDLAAVDLTDISRGDIEAAFGIPQSIMRSLSSTYASAKADDWHFISKTIVPHTDVCYAEPLNIFFRLSGITFEFKPEEHQSYQAYQVEEALSLVPLINAGIMPIWVAQQQLGLPEEVIQQARERWNAQEAMHADKEIESFHLTEGVVNREEVRLRLGLNPEDNSKEQRRRDTAAALSILKTATDAGMPLEQALLLADIPVAPQNNDNERTQRARALLTRLRGKANERPDVQRERERTSVAV